MGKKIAIMILFCGSLAGEYPACIYTKPFEIVRLCLNKQEIVQLIQPSNSFSESR